MSLGLNNGIRALLSAQSVLDTIGHNLANANTRGYSRQRVDLSASRAASVRGVLIGQGVEIGGISRAADLILNDRILSQLSLASGFNAQLGHMLEVESFFAEGTESSVGTLMNTMFTNLAELSSSPNDAVLRVGVVDSARGFASQVRDVANTLDGIQANVRGQLGIEVGLVNELTTKIAGLNVSIADAQGAGLAPNDLLDQRDLALRDLAEYVDITVQNGPGGAVRVSTAGQVIVGESQSFQVELFTDEQGALATRLKGGTSPLNVTGGSLGGLLGFQAGFSDGLSGDLDDLIRNLILETNRVHSTGVPSSGGFRELVATNRLVDADGNGDFGDERLGLAGLPFDVQEGEVFINVTEPETGAIQKHRIAVTEQTTVRDFLDQINGIPDLTASVDSLGHLRIGASAGHQFDFSGRLDTSPNDAGGFGASQASLGSGGAGPFALLPGDTLDVTAGGVPLSLSFDGADFQDITNATADEVAAVINADPTFQANGVVASAQGGRLFLQSATEGSAAAFTLDGGSSAAAFGWSGLTGSTITGQDGGVDITLSGTYEGDANDTYTFVPNMDGEIGATPGLTVSVYDQSGSLVTTLDVGEDYEPGSELEVANGVAVSFGLGEVSAANNDAFSADLQADSDTSDLLVALGMNGFFSGTGAKDIDVAEHLQANPDLIASSGTGFEGNNETLLGMLSLQTSGLEGLGGESVNVTYSNFVGRLGFEVGSVRQGLESSAMVLEGLDARREQLAGVNVDEELVDLVRFEQAYSAAARYLTVLQDLDQQIMNII